MGGTQFVGRAVADDALGRGWDVAVFHRGRDQAPAGAMDLRGDRTQAQGLAALAHGEWDIVLDTWTGAPTAVRDAARLLADRAGHYVYVSSRSVYDDCTPAVLTEDAPVVDSSPDAEDVPYAKAKRGGELAAIAAFGDRALLARGGLILGPRENVGRLPWWLNRIAEGGPVLAPGPHGLPLQYIDARDLAAWVLDAAARGLNGAYNVVSPSGHTTMGELLDTCVRVTGSDARLRWSEPAAILAAGIEGWTELPIWIAPGKDHRMMHHGDVTKATRAGLRCRPVAQTVADTWAWLRRTGGTVPQRPGQPPIGLDRQREAQFLRGPAT